jgi:hypothetical protein
MADPDPDPDPTVVPLKPALAEGIKEGVGKARDDRERCIDAHDTAL